MSEKKKTPPLKPMALINFKKTDDELAKIIGNFWKLTWNRENPAIDQKTKYMLSLSNAVGANRFRQATRELVKAYAAGTTIAEFDELFSLFVWNQGAGHFASEIGPSQLFAAYQFIKTLEHEGLPREEVAQQLVENFGEKNRSVAVGMVPGNLNN
jgi:alkylhydroperoxidase/carboxymuconolactone decarboxylase family protein YurZ